MRTPMGRLHSQSGLSLILVLVIIGVLAGLPAIIIASHEQILSSMSHSNNKSDALRLMASIQQLFQQRLNCKDALKRTDGSVPHWANGADEEIGSVRSGTTTLASTDPNDEKNKVGRNMRIAKMILHKGDSSGPGVIFKEEDGEDFQAYQADLVIYFKSDSGSTPPPEKIAINIATNSAGQVTNCPGTYRRASDTSCSDADCDLTSRPAPYCTPISFVTRFSGGNPVCECKWSCPTPTP